MRKLLVALVLMLSLGVMAQTVEIGTGHIWTGTGNYLYNLDSAHWQVNAGFNWNFTDHSGLRLNLSRDGASIINWANKHQFTRKHVYDYEYTVVDVSYQYTFLPDGSVSPFVYGGLSEYTNNGLWKTGYIIGGGMQFNLSEHWYISTTIAYRHVQNFIVPVANVAETRLSVGFRF